MDSITPEKLLRNSFFLTHFLLIKYGNAEENFEAMMIDSLVFSLPSHYFSEYKEAMVMNDNDEFLKRRYSREEAATKITKLASYYKNYQAFFCRPLFRDLTYGAILQNYGEHKAEIFYKRTYGAKHAKRERNTNDNDHNISVEHSSEGGERDFIEENRTIFDFASRKTIEKLGVTSMELIANQSNAKNELVLSNYNNENIFYTKRGSIEDSLVGIVNYMDKQRMQQKKTQAINNREKHYESNCIRSDINSNQLGRRYALLRGGQSHNVISVEKMPKTFLMTMMFNSRRNKPFGSSLTHTPCEFVKVISPKISHSKSNSTQQNHPTSLSPPYKKHSHLKLTQRHSMPITNLSKPSCSNNLRTESNLSRNKHSKQSMISKYLSSQKEPSKNNSPQPKKSFSLYKKPINKPIPPSLKTNQNNFFNYINNCAARAAHRPHNITKLLDLKRYHLKDKSTSMQTTQRGTANKKASSSVIASKKNTTRNFENPLIRATFNSNYTLDNQLTSTMRKEYNNNLTTHWKINVNLTMHTVSNVTTSSKAVAAKQDISKRTKTISQAKKQKESQPHLTSAHSSTQTNIFSSMGILTNIHDLKNELNGKFTKHIAQKDNGNHSKPKRSAVVKGSVKSKLKAYIDHSQEDLHKKQGVNQIRNERIIVNRMNCFKSLNYNSGHSDEKLKFNRGNKDKEDSTWSKSGTSNGNNRVIPEQ